MLNVQQLTSQLAKMPDPMLQKYAAMHKDDPYIVALAVGESNRRKEMRTASQGAAQPQPKVVDQDIANMAAPMPEDTGIAQLPAGNMNFAEGGIVAFADGGDVERYQYGGALSGTEYAIPGYVQPQQLLGAPQRGAPENTPWLQRLQQEAEDEGLRYQVAQAQARLAAGQGTSADKAVLAQFEASQRTAERPGALPASFDKYLAKSAPAAAAAAPSAGPSAAAANAGIGQPLQTPPAPSAAPAIGGSAAGLESMYKRIQKPLEADQAEVKKQRETYAAGLSDYAKKELADFDAEQAKQGDVFKGREARLAQREGEVEGMKDKNLGLALLQAGAAMMSTPGGLGVALGKGVNVGATQYASGIDKINAAQERLMDAKDKLEELRVNRDDMTAKERRALTSQINRATLEGKKLFLDGAEKDLGYKREDAKTLFAGMTTVLGHEISASGTVRAAEIKERSTNAYMEYIRGAQLVENAKKNLAARIKEQYKYDTAAQEKAFQTAWEQELQKNPTLAKYAGYTPGGGGAASSDPLGLRQ